MAKFERVPDVFAYHVLADPQASGRFTDAEFIDLDEDEDLAAAQRHGFHHGSQPGKLLPVEQPRFGIGRFGGDSHRQSIISEQLVPPLFRTKVIDRQIGRETEEERSLVQDRRVILDPLYA